MEVVISPNGNDISGDGTYSKPFVSFRRALEVPGSKITMKLTPGRFLVNSSIVVGAMRFIAVAGTGSSTVLDLGRTRGLVKACAGSISLSDLTVENSVDTTIDVSAACNLTLSHILFRNNSAPSGGALRLAALARIKSCSFVNNSASNNSQGGGAVMVLSTADVLFSDCSFSNNWAAGSGGAVAVQRAAEGSPVAMFHRCGFEANEALQHGGALFLDGLSQGNMTHSNFSSNVASVGGAVYSTSALSADECIFSGNRNAAQSNTDDVGGGAMSLHGTAFPLVSNCVFLSNAADGAGGALAFYTSGSLTSSVFVGNFVTNPFIGAGAVWIGSQGNTSMVVNCRFSENWAVSFGGAIGLTSAVAIHNCTFFANSADSNQLGGGAVWIAVTTVAAVTNLSGCQFRNNTSGGAGGAVMLLSSARFTECSFTDNLALGDLYGGGAVQLGSHVLMPTSFLRCMFHNNTAQGGGGALALYSGAVVTTCSFGFNHAPNGGNGGGAVYLRSVLTTNFTMCHFFNNQAFGGGGAIILYSVATFDSCSFHLNLAPDDSNGGGAIYVNNGIGSEGPVFISCLFLNNTAPGGGGALVLYSPAQLHGCNFSNNGAPRSFYGGGAVTIGGLPDLGPTLVDCTFTGNVALGGGGALDVNAVATFRRCSFDRNIAPDIDYAGGAVRIRPIVTGLRPEFDACVFTNNRALGVAGAVILVSSAVFSNCRFVGNAVGQLQPGPAREGREGLGGGAIWVATGVGGTPPQFRSCQFQNNVALFGVGGAVALFSETNIQGSSFHRNSATVGGGAVFVYGRSIFTFIGCIFSRNTDGNGTLSTMTLVRGAFVDFRTGALCDTDAAGSINCVGPTKISSGFSSVVAPSEIAPPPCILQERIGSPIVLSGSSTILLGAVCGATPQLLWTSRPPEPAPFVLTALHVALLAPPLWGFAVSPPMSNTTSPAQLTNPNLLGTVVTVDSESSSATATRTNTENGECNGLDCYPAFGILVRPREDLAADQPTAFALDVRQQGLSLSLAQSTVDVVGFPIAWVGVPVQLLVHLKNQLKQSYPQAVKIRVGGSNVLCGSGSSGQGVSYLHLCSFTFHSQDHYSVSVFDEQGTYLGDLGNTVQVVSLGWPIAGGVLLVVGMAVAIGWWGYRAWGRRRQRQADLLLANYVGLSGQSRKRGKRDGADENSDESIRTWLATDGEQTLVDKSFFIPFESIDLRQDIAAGAAGKVSLGTWKGTTVAVKRLYAMKSGEERQTFVKELVVHRSLRHRNVVQLLGVCLDPLCIVLEFMERGSLFACLQERDVDMPWNLRVRCALDVARGMVFLHAEGILHRDLKSLNVLVDDNWRCKVADFDQSRADAGTLTATVGTVLWSAPEVLEGKGEYGKAADVYSFGIVMFECWTREPPFQHSGAPGRQQVRGHILSGGRPEVEEGVMVAHDEDYTALMRQCWAENPASRPTFEGVCESCGPEEVAESSGERGSKVKRWFRKKRASVEARTPPEQVPLEVLTSRSDMV